MINETFVSSQNTAGIDTLNSLSGQYMPFVMTIGAVCIVIMFLFPIIEGWLKRK